MQIVAIGIISPNDEFEYCLSHHSDIGRLAKKSLSTTRRIIMFDPLFNEHQLYKVVTDQAYHYSFVKNGYTYTFCTNQEIYPYTPARLNHIHRTLLTIAAYHQSGQHHYINELLTHDFAETLPSQQDHATIQIRHLKHNHVDQLAAHLTSLTREIDHLSENTSSFARQSCPAKKKANLTSGIRWLFSLFSFCGSCLQENNKPRYQRR